MLIGTEKFMKNHYFVYFFPNFVRYFKEHVLTHTCLKFQCMFQKYGGMIVQNQTVFLKLIDFHSFIILFFWVIQNVIVGLHTLFRRYM